MHEHTPSWLLGVDWTEATSRRRARADRYELRLPLGVGGFGEVWRGEHVDTGRVVALKVLHHQIAAQRSFQTLLLQECQLVARLRHPCVVRVHDVGVLGEAIERATGGRFVAGSPYVAMELLEGGTLDAWVRSPREWSEVRRVVLEMLGALRHAHARGVVHLDLKPSNVLFRRDGRSVIADFGIAWSMRDDDAPRFTGTLAYASPEQLVADARALGPCSDLFALGALIWELVTGAPPFVASNVAERLFQTPGAFEPRVDVPTWLFGWLSRLLEPSIKRRFATASEAMAALHSAEGAPRTPVWPSDWRDGEPTDHEPRPDFLGATATCFVGRVDARDRLWQGARRVLETGAAEELVVRGPEGAGKTRLAQWLTERALEQDAFEVLWVRGELGETLDRALVKHLRLEGLGARRMRDALAWAGDTLASAVADGCARADGGCPRVWEALLEAMTTRRPVLVVLDGEVDVERPPGGRMLRLRLTREPGEGLTLEPLGLGDARALAALCGGRFDERTSRQPGVLIAQHSARPCDEPGRHEGACVLASLAALPEAEVRALEVLAVADAPMRIATWERVARACGAHATWTALDHLVREGLGHLDEGHVTLASREVVDALALRARGRASAIHVACAHLLEVLEDGRDRHERVARHWIAAGAKERALEPLSEAAETRLRHLDRAGAETLARQQLGTCDALGFAPLDARRFRASLVLATCLRESGALDEAVATSAHAAAMARAAGDVEGHARAEHQRARALHRRGDTAGAILVADGAVLSVGDDALRAGWRGDAQLDVGAWLLERAAFDEADARFVLASETHPSRAARALAVLYRARVARLRGDGVRARALVEAATTELLRAGRHYLLPEAFFEAGEVERACDEPEVAVAWYRRALEGAVALGRDTAVEIELALGMVLAELGRVEEAALHLDGAYSAMEARGDVARARAWGLARAWAHACVDDWRAARDALRGVARVDDAAWDALFARFVARARRAGHEDVLGALDEAASSAPFASTWIGPVRAASRGSERRAVG
ncbi:MAG: serine/threonine-protein kinase [Polyangiales bacterium]